MSVTECPRCGGPVVKYTDRVNYQCTQCYVIILAEEDFYSARELMNQEDIRILHSLGIQP